MFTRSTSVLKRVAGRVRPHWGLMFGAPFTRGFEKQFYRGIIAAGDADIEHAPLALHPTCLNGQTVWCRPGTRDRSALEDLLFHQVYLPPQPLPAPRCIVDLGANVGYTVAHLAHTYPSARVIGVELDRENYLLALKNTETWGERVRMINAAIWSSDGEVAFGGRGEDAFKVLSAVQLRGDLAAGARIVRALSMPSLMRECQLTHIDYLKMDIEGAEKELILDSDCSWLRQVDALKIELHQLDPDDFVRVLRAYGFDCRQDKREWTCIAATRR